MGEAERKRLAEERAKRAEAAKKARIASQNKGEKTDEQKDDEAKDEELKDEKVEDDEALPTPELTEEEKQQWSRKSEFPDLDPAKLAKVFADFSLPTQDDGFKHITFEWQNEEKSAQLLKEYVHEKKMTQRVEDLTPGEWFGE